MEGNGVQMRSTSAEEEDDRDNIGDLKKHDRCREDGVECLRVRRVSKG